MNKKVELTSPEEKFYDLLVDYEIMSMVRDFKSQVWMETSNGYRRIDFILIIDDTKGIYIEIDDPSHNRPERMLDDENKTREIFHASYPLLRFTYNAIFNNTERVMNEIEGCIDLMRNA